MSQGCSVSAWGYLFYGAPQGVLCVMRDSKVRFSCGCFIVLVLFRLLFAVRSLVRFLSFVWYLCRLFCAHVLCVSWFDRFAGIV